jgi:hypothetical protein
MAWNIAKTLERIESKIDTLTLEISKITEGVTQMALDISALQTAVANETTVEQSAIVLINGLVSQIQTLINSSGNTVDPTVLQGLVNQMVASQTSLASAVTTNTGTPPTVPQAAPLVAAKP